jgi:hypothetical protein
VCAIAIAYAIVAYAIINVCEAYEPPMNDISYSESLGADRLASLAREVWGAAFPGEEYPNDLSVVVAAGFYLPRTIEVILDRAPLIVCPPSTRAELVRTLVHEFCHHRVGYADRPAHGDRFRQMHERALRNLSSSPLGAHLR